MRTTLTFASWQGGARNNKLPPHPLSHLFFIHT
jgi:hypothetical protein